MGKHLKLYGMKFGDGLINSDNFSKVLEYSRGDATRFTRNVINIRMGNHKFNLAGGLKNLKTYFADTNFIKKHIVTPSIEKIKRVVNAKIKETVTDAVTGIAKPLLSEEQRTKLEKALKKLDAGKQDVNAVEDGTETGKTKSDFNAENIKSGKEKVAEGIEDIKKVLGSEISTKQTSGDESSSESINLDSEKKNLKHKLNYMRKISLEQFEEEYSAELHIGGYVNMKYTKTLDELCAWLQDTLAGYAVKYKINPDKYRGDIIEVDSSSSKPESFELHRLEADIQVQLTNKKVPFTKIEIEKMYEFDDAKYDPD